MNIFIKTFQNFNTKPHKITKNARVLLYFCVYKFFHEQTQTRFFKNMQKTRSRYTDGHQNRFKNYVFSCKIIIMLSYKNHYFSPFPVYKWCKKSNKNHSFLTSQFMFFTCKIAIFIVPGM